MYEVSDLFDMRSTVGAKLEMILCERGLTKAAFCSASGMSRPTLDKLLSANITSKTNFEKHIKKALDSLKITPDMLMSNVRNRYNQCRLLKNMLHVDERNLAEFAGVSVKRLKEMEAGAEADLSELRDIALKLRTGVRCLLGKNYFEPQIAMYESALTPYGEYAKNGFWGHIGILPSSSKECHWYPVTGNTRSMIHASIEHKRIVVPCMNNKILWINMKNVDQIILLDDACDQPDSVNWDPSVSCGEIPLVVYESLSDYMYYKDSGEEIPVNVISQNLCARIESFIEENDYVKGLVTIYYPNGKINQDNIDFNNYENISSEISSICEFGDIPCDQQFLFYRDSDAAEIFLNSDTISFIELPLLEIEDAICRELDKENAEYC